MNKRPEILFVFPHIDRTFCYPLGASYIIAYLKQRGVYAKQFICSEFIGFKELIEKILAEQPKIIGFTCYDSNYGFVKLIAQHLKMKNQDILIFAGGPTATFSDRVIMKDTPEIDICVRGEGEQTAFEIIQECQRSRQFSYISGITYRKAGQIIQNIDRPLIRDNKNKDSELDLIPSPYITGVLDPLDQLKRNGDISILTARGCIHRCVYCNLTSMSRYTIRYHSTERVISELRIISNLKEQDTTFKISIQDDIFTLNRERVRQICQRLIKENLNLPLWIDTRVDLVDRELLELLFKAGVRGVNFGLESAVPKVLYNIKKVRFTYSAKNNFGPEKKFIQKMKDNVRLAKEIGFKTSVSIMLGLPGERLKDGLRTINFVKNLKVDKYFHNKLKIYSGTELCQTYKKYNLRFSRLKFGQVLHNPLFSPLIYGYDVRKVPSLTNRRWIKEELEYMRYYLIDALMGSYKFSETKKICHYPRDIILINNNFHFGWLKENTSFKTRFIYSKDMNSLLLKDNSKNKLLKISIFGFYPEFKIFSVPDAEEKLCEGIEEFRSKFLYTQFSQFDKLEHKLRNNGDALLYISSEGDLEELRKQALLAKENKAFVFHKDNNCRYLILDACRWSAMCPAIKLPRLIIDSNENILPCFQGKAVGRVGDRLEQIHKNMVGLVEQKKNKRRCNSCPVRDDCSKCLFINSIGIDKYCKIKREFPYISTFINLIQIAQKTRYYYDFVLRYRNS